MGVGHKSDLRTHVGKATLMRLHTELSTANNVLANSQEVALLNVVCELTFEVDAEQKRIEMRPTNN
jgi:hypothetical protein